MGASYGTERQHRADLPPHSFLGTQPMAWLAQSSQDLPNSGWQLWGQSQEEEDTQPLQEGSV